MKIAHTMLTRPGQQPRQTLTRKGDSGVWLRQKSASEVPILLELEITRHKRILSRDQDGGKRHDHNGKRKDPTLGGFPQSAGHRQIAYVKFRLVAHRESPKVLPACPETAATDVRIPGSPPREGVTSQPSL